MLRQSIRKLFSNIDKSLPDTKDIVRALDLSAESIITEAKLRTPVDHGLLKASYSKDIDDHNSDKNIKVTISNNQEYAVYVHENLEAFHKVGEAKFLENAVNEKKQSVKKRLSSAISKSLIKG